MFVCCLNSQALLFHHVNAFMHFNHKQNISPGQFPSVIFTLSMAISPVYEFPTIPSNVTCKTLKAFLALRFSYKITIVCKADRIIIF